MAGITAGDVADYMLASVDEDSGDNISNLKLQKLVYYAQGFHLALCDGEPLFDEPIEAWAHGPVVPDLYHQYKIYGAGAIPAPQGIDFSKFDAVKKELLDEVLRVYGQFSAWKLRDMTHAESTWAEAGPNGTISRDAMRDYFKTLVVDGQKTA